MSFNFKILKLANNYNLFSTAQVETEEEVSVEDIVNKTDLITTKEPKPKRVKKHATNFDAKYYEFIDLLMKMVSAWDRGDGPIYNELDDKFHEKLEEYEKSIDFDTWYKILDAPDPGKAAKSYSNKISLEWKFNSKIQEFKKRESLEDWRVSDVFKLIKKVKEHPEYERHNQEVVEAYRVMFGTADEKEEEEDTTVQEYVHEKTKEDFLKKQREDFLKRHHKK